MICTMVGLTIYGLTKGNIWKVIGGIKYDANGNGLICGASEGVKDTKFLYLSDISLPEGANGDSIINIFRTGVCVSECPAANGAIACSESEQARCDSFDANTRYETVLVGPYCFPKDLKAINGNQLNGWNAIIDKIRSSNAGQFIMDLHNTATSVYICLGLAFVLSIFYIYMMSFAANCMSKIAILIIELCVIAGIALTFFHAHSEV